MFHGPHPDPLPEQGDFLDSSVFWDAPMPHNPAVWGATTTPASEPMDTTSWSTLRIAGQCDVSGAWLLLPTLVDAVFPFLRPEDWAAWVHFLAQRVSQRWTPACVVHGWMVTGTCQHTCQHTCTHAWWSVLQSYRLDHTILANLLEIQMRLYEIV
jgi:hypothetical protein